MTYLLNVVYLAIIALASPWLLWQGARRGKYRQGWGEKFFGRAPRRSGNSRCLWIHAVSVGEVNLLAPLIERWERLRPGWEIVISSTTLAGFQLAQKRYSPRTVFYCPLDFSWAVTRAMKRVRPDLLVLAELELWPNLVKAAHYRGTKVAIINGRLSDKSFRGYQRIRWLAERVLQQVDLILVQNDEYADRFRSLGARPDAVQVTGSMKFDGAKTDRDNVDTQRLARLAGIGSSDVVFLAGSTQEPEESLALDVYQELIAQYPRLRLILVPRHPERFDAVADMLNRRGVRWQRRSRLEMDRADSAAARILLVDVVGELGAWWGTAQIAFVGGSLGQRGGQNMIEPSGYGAAVSFGPNTWNFRDVVGLLLAQDAAVVVRDGKDMLTFVRRCAADPAYAAELGARARDLVLKQQGAADRTVAMLAELAPSANRRESRHAA